MNKKNINLLYIFIIFTYIVILFFNNSILSISIIDSSILFIKNVFPFLFIMIILNNLLIDLNLPYYISKITKSSYIYIFIMSLLSGSPINAIIIKDFIDKKYINTEDASIILSFTNFNNPLFLYNFFLMIFNNKLISIKLFFIIYLCNKIILLVYKGKLKNNYYSIPYKKYNLITSLINSITKSINSLIKIFAIIVLFKLLTDIIFVNNSLIGTILRGLIEITQGLNSINSIDISITIKQIIVLIIIIFSGFSIHIQISEILKDYQINFKYFYVSKAIMIIIAIILVLIL